MWPNWICEWTDYSVYVRRSRACIVVSTHSISAHCAPSSVSLSMKSMNKKHQTTNRMPENENKFDKQMLVSEPQRHAQNPLLNVTNKHIQSQSYIRILSIIVPRAIWFQ